MIYTKVLSYFAGSCGRKISKALKIHQSKGIEAKNHKILRKKNSTDRHKELIEFNFYLLIQSTRQIKSIIDIYEDDF